MNQMTYNSPYMNPYGPTPIILSPEEKKRKREAEIAKRLAVQAQQNAANRGQDKYSRMSDGILDYSSYVAQDRRNGNMPSMHSMGSDVGDVALATGRGLSNLAGATIPPVLDVFADTVEGGANFVLGGLGRDEMPEGKRFRNGDDFNPFNYKQRLVQLGLMDAPLDPSQVDLSGLEQYRPNGILANAQDIDMGGAGVLRLDTPVDTPVDKPIEAAVEEIVDQSKNPVATVAETDLTKKAPKIDKEGTLRGIAKAADIDMSGTATGNKRDQTSMAIPRIGMREKLMRIGGAITAASGQGGLASIGAGTQMYGSLQDEERRLAQQDLQNQQAEQARQAKIQAAQKAAEAERFGSPAEIYAAQELVGKLSDLRGLLSSPDINAVGASKNFLVRKVGAAMGTDESIIRMRLQELVVDKTLANTAFTKGAISDKEMALFRSDIPEFTDGEARWLDWLKRYEEATRMLEHNLRTGYSPYLEQNRGGYNPQDTSDDDDLFNY